VVLCWVQKPAPGAVEGESGLGLAKEPVEAKQTAKRRPSRPVIAIAATAVSSNDPALAWPPQRDNPTQGQPVPHFGGPNRRKASVGKFPLPTAVPISERGNQAEAPLAASNPYGHHPAWCPTERPPRVPHRDNRTAEEGAVLCTPPTLASVPRKARTVDACVARAGAMSCPGGSRPPRTLGERPRPQRALAPARPRSPGLGLCAALQDECILNSCPANRDSVPTVHTGEPTLEEQRSKGKGLPQKAFPFKRKAYLRDNLPGRGERAPRQPTVPPETDAKPLDWSRGPKRARVDDPFQRLLPVWPIPLGIETDLINRVYLPLHIPSLDPLAVPSVSLPAPSAVPPPHMKMPMQARWSPGPLKCDSSGMTAGSSGSTCIEIEAGDVLCAAQRVVIRGSPDMLGTIAYNACGPLSPDAHPTGKAGSGGFTTSHVHKLDRPSSASTLVVCPIPSLHPSTP
jgi:hypothetical protein